MNIDSIKHKADEEIIKKEEFINFINEIKEKIKKYPKGFDIKIPNEFINITENFCDSNEIPCHPVCENTMCFASSYSNLYYYEKSR